jgi:2-methylcitrate dehydratase PrpD
MSQAHTDARVTRRTLLKSGLAAAAAGLALPRAAGGATSGRETLAEPGTPPESVMPALVSYMSEAQTRPLPAEAAEHTRLHVLDTFAAMVSGSNLPPGRAALRFVDAYDAGGGGGGTTVVRSKRLAGPIEAALANAMMAHADETDDSHAPSQSHPGCSIVPATLAAAERFETDGARFLRAVALGYDIGTRVNMALRVSNFEVGSHLSSHAMAAVWGSSAAAGCAAGLSAEQLPWLLAYAADQSSGLTVWQRDSDHIQKAFAFAGLGARNGVTAAIVVRSGWTGVNDVLAGPYNFFNAYAPASGPDLELLVDKLGERYEVVRTNVKKWTVGSPIQAPLDAIERLRLEHPFTADQVQRVVVRTATSEAKLVDNRDMPDICMQHMVAVMLLDKTASFASAHDKPRMQDPAVLKQRAKVTLIQDEELEKLLPKRVAIVDVTLTDGTKLTQRVDAVRGTVQNPMTRAEIVAKARDLMAPVLGAASTSRLIDKVLALDTVRDIRELRPLLQGT